MPDPKPKRPNPSAAREPEGMSPAGAKSRRFVRRRGRRDWPPEDVAAALAALLANDCGLSTPEIRQVGLRLVCLTGPRPEAEGS